MAFTIALHISDDYPGIPRRFGIEMFLCVTDFYEYDRETFGRHMVIESGGSRWHVHARRQVAFTMAIELVDSSSTDLAWIPDNTIIRSSESSVFNWGVVFTQAIACFEGDRQCLQAGSWFQYGDQQDEQLHSQSC